MGDYCGDMLPSRRKNPQTTWTRRVQIFSFINVNAFRISFARIGRCSVQNRGIDKRPVRIYAVSHPKFLRPRIVDARVFFIRCIVDVSVAQESASLTSKKLFVRTPTKSYAESFLAR
jgi:hypothetical protein